MKISGRGFGEKTVEGEVLYTNQPISFLGGINPESGVIREKGHELEGSSVSEKIFVFPKGKGSTVGSYVLYQLKKNKKAPKAIINRETEPIVAVGAIISEIPLIDKINIKKLPKKGETKVNAKEGWIEF